MSMDITPDGQWIVFDLLGHVYRMPAAGGTAESLTQGSGIAMNIEPRISPDGKRIAFVSDRGGQNNLWVMDLDGGNPTSVYLDPGARIEFPMWSADGEYLFALKRRGLVARSIWMWSRRGGRGVEVVKSVPGRTPGRFTVSADGRFLYYEVYTGTFTGEFGKDDLLKGAMQLIRRDLATGQDRAITAGEIRAAGSRHQRQARTQPKRVPTAAGSPSSAGSRTAPSRRRDSGSDRGRRCGSGIWSRDPNGS